MKPLFARVALLASAGYFFWLLWQTVAGLSFVTDSSMTGPDFWNDRRKVVATLDRPVIPVQLPGPLDQWAGPGPKEIVINVKGKSETTVDLYFLDSHESAPPRLEILVNGALIGDARVEKGAGVNRDMWRKSGKPSSVSVTIPKSARKKGKDEIVIRNIEGSWVAFEKIKVNIRTPYVKLGGALLIIILLLGWVIHGYREDKASRPAASGASVKYVIFALIATGISSSFALVAGEIVLRIVYRDGGSTTSEGPGGKPFAHTYLNSGDRFAGNGAEKESDSKKIFIQGDSITYGLGVKEWEAIYPNLLYEKLVRSGDDYRMTVKAIPNRELDFHRAKLYEMGESLDPDIIVYQWFNNDIELEYCHNHTCGRPEHKISFWRKFSFHQWIKDRSYLYFFLDVRLAQTLPDYNRSYIEYLTDDFAEGRVKGQRFRTEFYRWATVASAYAERVIVMLYPALPISGENPFKAQHDLMRRLSGPHTFHIAAYTTQKKTGRDIFTDGNGINHIARQARAGIDKPGILVDGPAIPFREGRHEVSFRLKAGSRVSETVAVIKALGESSGEVLGQAKLSGNDFKTKDKWREFKLAFEIKDTMIKDLHFQVWYGGKADIAVDRISVPVNRRLELIDLIPHLKGFDTHTSDFDWHPNKKAHQVIAKLLFETITGKNGEK